MTTKIKIQSISDVITNSSTEIYTVWDRNKIEKTIKDMVNSILNLGQADLCYDDLFTIEIHWEDEDNWKEKGYLSKEDFITDLEKSNGRIEDYGYNNWYEVKPKPEAEKYLDVKKIADLITHIQDTFESSENYDC